MGSRRWVSVVASTVVMVLSGVFSTTAFAIEIDPTPDAPLGDGAPVISGGIDGGFELLAPPLGSAIAVDGAVKDCFGCAAHSYMYWTNYGAWERVGVKHNNNHAEEVIGKQNHHVALMNSTNKRCYDGDFKFTKSSGNIYNHGSYTASLSSGKFTAWNDKWTLASGHNWYEDGVHWEVSGGVDMCKQF